MSWARVIATLVIIFGFIGYAYYAAVTAAQKLYERGVLKEPPVPMLDVRAIAIQVAQYTAIAVTLLIIAIVAKRLVESKRLLGIVPVKDFQRHLLIVGPTGSGKTNTAKQAISLGIQKGVKVVILDWKALPLRTPLQSQLGPAAAGLLVRLGGPREESTSVSSREPL
ncbi:MAG: ATP-binding protein [Aigarchaeota archaeon]|nr:ATP-binding protein [Candidatus Caldarchaeales archaeon]